jgi:antitoxin component YwqK of YwqJK toxin-antitoxin module
MKTTIQYIILLIMTLTSYSISAQKGYADKINQSNSEGQKEGFWKEDLKYQTTETYYHNGLKSGLFKAFSKKGELSCLGEYTKNEITGTWYYFGDYGHLIMIQSYFQKNTFKIPLEHQAQGVCPFRCYCIDFYPNGNKKSEGIMLFDKDPESDFTFEYGEWKYYDENGNLTKTKVFK